MRRLARAVAATAVVTLVVAAATAWLLYRRATASAPEYDAAVTRLEALGPEAREEARLRLESRFAALASDLQKPGTWRARIAEVDLNAWLAESLDASAPEFAAGEIADPRVLVTAESITFAARARVGSVHGVLVAVTRPFATDKGELALEVLATRVGTLDAPRMAVVERLRQLSLERVAPVRWRLGEQSAVLAIDPAPLAPSGGAAPRLRAVELRDGEVLLTGESVARESDSEPASGEAGSP